MVVAGRRSGQASLVLLVDMFSFVGTIFYALNVTCSSSVIIEMKMLFTLFVINSCTLVYL